MQTITLSIDGMTCGHCVASVRHALAAVPGIEIRDVRLGSAELGLDDAATGVAVAAIAAVEDAGYPATVAPIGVAAEPSASAGAGGAPRSTPIPLSSRHR